MARADAVVSIPPDRLEHMVRDTPSWPLWDPGVVEAAILDGSPGRAGMVARLTVGNHRVSWPVVHMLVAVSDETNIFAGGGRRWCFIEVIRLSPLVAGRTRIQRRMEIRLCGPLRWAGPLVRSYIARHLRRSLDALT